MNYEQSYFPRWELQEWYAARSVWRFCESFDSEDAALDAYAAHSYGSEKKWRVVQVIADDSRFGDEEGRA